MTAITGVGTDIVEMARVESVWHRYGLRFAERVLTAGERERCLVMREPWRFLAKRFAAKEAVAKAFGCGIGAELSWQDVEIDSSVSGAPQVTLTPRAAALLRRRGGRGVMVSISDERAYAVAFAVVLA